MTSIASLKKEKKNQIKTTKTQDLQLTQLLVSCAKTFLAASAKAHSIPNPNRWANLSMNEKLVSKQSVVPCRRPSETLKFGIEQVDRGRRDNEADISRVSPLSGRIAKDECSKYQLHYTFKDGAYYCYCAYVLRISRYSSFISVMLTNTGIFFRGLKLSGESR